MFEFNDSIEQTTTEREKRTWRISKDLRKRN